MNFSERTAHVTADILTNKPEQHLWFSKTRGLPGTLLWISKSLFMGTANNATCFKCITDEYIYIKVRKHTPFSF